MRVSVLLGILEPLDIGPPKFRALLYRNSISPSQLDDPYSRIPLGRFVSLFEDLAIALDRPFLGAEVGARYQAADMGPIGILFSISSSLRIGFERFSRYLSAFATSTDISLIPEGDDLIWTYRIGDPAIWPRRQDAEYAISATCQMIRDYLGESWRPVAVHFEHAEPPDAECLGRLFKAPMHFAQPTNAVVFRQDQADRVTRREDTAMVAVLERHIHDLMATASDQHSVSDSVRSYIAMYIGHASVTLPAIADALGIPARTLQRQLTREGTSIRALVREERERLALRLLREGNPQISALADTLGYSAPTAFSRAFKTWTGRRPKRG